MDKPNYPGLPKLPIRISAKAVIVKDGAVLLNKIQGGEYDCYNWPGGGQEWGETIEESLHREVWEETGSEIDIQSLFCIVEYLPKLESAQKGWPQTVIFIFLCNLKDGSQPKLPDPPDKHQVALEWVRIDELKNYWVGPWISDEVQAWYRGENLGVPIVVSREGE